MPTLVVETGSAITNANAYCTLAEANSYNDEHPHGTSWLSISSNDKNRSIIMATRTLDEQIDWYGEPTFNMAESISSSNAGNVIRQFLRFPRSGVYDQDGYVFDNKSIPTWLKNATSEFARYLAENDRTAEPDTQGFGQVRLGSLTVDIDKFDQPPILPRSVLNIVRPYGTVRGSNVGMVRRS